MWMRLPTMFITRRIYVIVLILPGLILLHVLLQTSQISLADSYRAGLNKALRPHSGGSVDERVGWHKGDSNAPNRDSIPGLGSTKSGSSWTDFGQRIGRLTGVAAGRRPATGSSVSSGATSSSFSAQRSGGSIYELVNQSPVGLYDARTSLDKLRLTSTRFVGARPPSPYHVFAHTPQRQHILVTGGFSSLGRSLVRDLLLLGGESGAEEDRQNRAAGKFGLSGLWGSGEEEDEYADDLADQAGPKKAQESDARKGIIVTILDTTNRSMELDDMLRHSPLYHRSRIGFNLLDTRSGFSQLWNGGGKGDSEESQDQSAMDYDGTPPLEFIDPRSADFSSSEVSLASFIAKGRLRVVKGDSRNTEQILQLLQSHSSAKAAEKVPEKTKFGKPKRPHYEEDPASAFPPVSGIFYLAGYENTDCKLKNPRDCADLERGGLRALADAVGKIDDYARPWIVAGDRGNLEEPEVAQWLQGIQKETSLRAEVSVLKPLQAAPATKLVEGEPKTQDKKPSKRSLASRSLYDSTSFISPITKLAKKTRIHALSLRLPPNSHIFGDSFAARSLPIPHLVHSAIGHLPIVLDDDTFPSMNVRVFDNSTFDNRAQERAVTRSVWDNTGVVYIDDVVEAFVAAGELLSRARNAEYVSRLSMLAEVDIVPPPRARSAAPYAATGGKSVAEETLDWIVQLTKSASPVGIVHSNSAVGAKQTLQGRPLDRSVARTILGTTPSTPLPLALKAYIRSLLGRQASFFDQHITEACAPPHDLRTLNDALAQLNTCSVQLLGLVSGENVVLACNPAYDYTPATSPIVLANAVPYTEKLSHVKLRSRWGPVGKVEVGLVCPFGDNGADETIVWLESTQTLEGRWATRTEASQLQEESTTFWSYDNFEVNFVRRDMRSFTLSIRQYPQAGQEAPKRRMVFAIDSSRKHSDTTMKDVLDLGWQTLAETEPDWQTMEWRVNPICCSEQQPRLINGFTFLQEDPLLTSQVLYPSPDGSNSVAESTYELQKCRDLRSAHEYSKKLNTWNEKSATSQTCPRSLGEGSDWLVHDLPICSINCDAPISCLVHDKCRCTRDRCGDERSTQVSPQTWAAFSLALSVDYARLPGDALTASVREVDNATKSETLREQVEALPWDAVVEPIARHVFSLPFEALPQGYAVELPEDVDTHMQNVSCYDVNQAEVPATGDHYLATALAQRSVDVEDADFAFIPYYQGCYFNYLHENTYKKLADSVAVAESQIILSDKLKASNIVVPFTHDWGSCTGWWPLLEDVLSRTPPPPMSKAISWQVNGDYNTRCIKAERDIVIPAVTKHIDALVKAYGDINTIRRLSERKNLAFFAGDVKGFGAFARTRLGCAAATPTSQGYILYETTTQGEDYIGKLNDAKFCLLPRGIAGWSNRAFDAIYAGCIPVFMADRTSFPFSSVLSYSAFSVTIAENRIHEIADILSAISDREVTAMQVALLKVRDAFIFSKDPTEEWTRRGPLYYTLVEMAQKLALQWPTLPVRNTCK